MSSDPETTLKSIIIDAIEELKGEDIVCLDVSEQTSFTDEFIIVTGRSTRQVRAIAEHVMLITKKQGLPAANHEGLDMMDWVVIDYGDIVLHVMLESTRMLYDLESLWSLTVTKLDIEHDESDETGYQQL